MLPRADLFNENTKIRMPDTFMMDETDDENQMVIFRTRLPIGDKMIPCAVFLDNSVFSIVRFLLGRDVIKPENKAAILEYLNNVNSVYKSFKFYIDEREDILLDVCVPSRDECFDVEIILGMIEMTFDHLKEEYAKLEALF